MREVDYLIVGQGLAGTALAWRAIDLDKRFLIVDHAEDITSSKVAAGIVNPITGGRLNLGWRVRDLWPTALDFYRAQERTLGASFFEEKPLLRLFTDADQAELWATRREDPAYEGYWSPLPEDVPRTYDCPFGGFETRCSGTLRTRPYLEVSRRHFVARDAYEVGNVEPQIVSPDPEGVRWKDVRARFVIWCQGHQNAANPWFDWVPIRPGKGEILTLRISNLQEHRILNCKQWLLPSSEFAGVFRAGSTFDWQNVNCEPTAAGRAEIESGLRGFLPHAFQTTGHEAAIRPMANHGRPLIGQHPAVPAQVLFNGLGAKGALLAPFYAAQLLDHLESGSPLDEAVTIDRFWK